MQKIKKTCIAYAKNKKNWIANAKSKNLLKVENIMDKRRTIFFLLPAHTQYSEPVDSVESALYTLLIHTRAALRFQACKISNQDGIGVHVQYCSNSSNFPHFSVDF
jgi:hypothetical protein